jgi:hypothetical protein
MFHLITQFTFTEFCIIFDNNFVPILVLLGRLLFQSSNKLKTCTRWTVFETIFGLTERLICNRISYINSSKKLPGSNTLRNDLSEHIVLILKPTNCNYNYKTHTSRENICRSFQRSNSKMCACLFIQMGRFCFNHRYFSKSNFQCFKEFIVVLFACI